MSDNTPVSDPTMQIVKDPEPKEDPSVAEKSGDAAPDETPAVEPVADGVPEFDRLVPTILLEDGALIEGSIGTGARDFRVTATNGRSYEHCGDHPNGRWIYRLIA